MGFTSDLSIYSTFGRTLELAKKISAENGKARKPLTEEAKQRKKVMEKAWREKRKAENLAQSALILSKR